MLARILEGSDGSLAKSADSNPSVVCLVGVNGAGKTTTAAKLAKILEADGGVVLGACDTFRAAANEQIRVWADRLGVRLVESAHGADAAATAWDCWQAAKSDGARWLVLDTAGRLHTKENLMGELAKIRRVLAKNDPNAPQNSILVIDASLGSNSISSGARLPQVFRPHRNNRHKARRHGQGRGARGHLPRAKTSDTLCRARRKSRRPPKI